MCITADLNPTFPGWNLTTNLVLALAANTAAGAVKRLKSEAWVPLKATPLMFKGKFPVFESV